MHYEELNCHIMLRIHSEKLEFKEIKKYKPDKTGSQVSFFGLIYMMIKRNNLKEVEHLEEENHCY